MPTTEEFDKPLYSMLAELNYDDGPAPPKPLVEPAPQLELPRAIDAVALARALEIIAAFDRRLASLDNDLCDLQNRFGQLNRSLQVTRDNYSRATEQLRSAVGLPPRRP